MKTVDPGNPSSAPPRRRYGAADRKLLLILRSPWFTGGMTLFWAAVAFADFRRHRFSWMDGLLVGVWGLLALIEVIALMRYRRTG